MRPEERLEQLFDAERRVEASAEARERIRQRLQDPASFDAERVHIPAGPLKFGPSLAVKIAVVVLGSAAAAAAVWGVGAARHYGKTSEVVRPIPSVSVPARPVPSGASGKFARPEAPRAPEAETESVESELGARSPSPPAPARASAELSPHASAEPRSPSFDEELALLKAAKTELNAGRPHLAKVWLDEHAHRFPNGVFAVEREGLQILIACSGPASSAGQRQARAFRARYPSSPLVDRLWRRCFPAGESPGPDQADPVPENVGSGMK